MDAWSWRFLRAERAEDYIRTYARHQKDGWKNLELPTTQRQFRTAADILNRLNAGRRGVLLADDVGLGKTTVATLCAFVVAGKHGRVRILAPNEMMATRWRQEITIHANALSEFADRLSLHAVRTNLGANVSKLNQGQIAVSTHAKATQLACDLLIVDEAHRTRSEDSQLASAIRRHRNDIGHIVVLTATPFSIDSRDLARLLTRVGADRGVIKSMSAFATQLDLLWRGKALGDPSQTAAQLADSAKAAVQAIAPYVIRHGIGDLSAAERTKFGEFVDDEPRIEIGEAMLEAMLRADRALLLGRRAKAWEKKRRNDPRYHVARGKLLADLQDLEVNLGLSESTDVPHAAEHVREALKLLEQVPVHPKVSATVAQIQHIVDSNEKVLVFCDHHIPAAELANELCRRMRRPPPRDSPVRQAWMEAWDMVLPAFGDDIGRDDGPMRQSFLDWLCSDAIRSQVASWLGAPLSKTTKPLELASMLKNGKARVDAGRDSIADQGSALYQQLTDEMSRSTRTELLKGQSSSLPGASMSKVCAVCEEPEDAHDPSIFFQKRPDTVLAIFDSPFGPDVLVTTDKLSEGVDLHRFCRYLIHHELDPSPVRTVQRNGRLRRVGSWAARTGKPIVVSYPALIGTRDERAVEIMQMRLRQFDLLLGGVGRDIDVDETSAVANRTSRILALARTRMGRLRLSSG
jgi:hypothetical protein